MDGYDDRFEKEYFDYVTDLQWVEETRHKMYRQELESYPLHDLARLWTEELVRAGLSKMDITSTAPPKWGEEAYDPRLEALGGDLYPVRLDESQRFVWINLDGERTTKGYRSIEVLDKPLLTDVAIIAVLTVLEGSRVQPFSKLPRAITAPLKAPLVDENSKKSLQEVIEELKGELATSDDAKSLLRLESLDYPIALLRERRPNFDSLPYEEQFALLEGTCYRMHEFSETLRKLVSFVEFAAFDPDNKKAKLPNRTRQNAHRSIRAAILRESSNIERYRRHETCRDSKRVEYT